MADRLNAKKYIFKQDIICTHYNDLYPEFDDLLQRDMFCKTGMIALGSTANCCNDYVSLWLQTQEGVIECGCKGELLEEYNGDRKVSNFIVELKNNVFPNEICFCKYCKKKTFGYVQDIVFNYKDIGTKFLCNHFKKVSLKELTISKAAVSGIMFLNKTGLDIFTGNIKNGPISCMDYYLITGGKQLGERFRQIHQ